MAEPLSDAEFDAMMRAFRDSALAMSQGSADPVSACPFCEIIRRVRQLAQKFADCRGCIPDPFFDCAISAKRHVQTEAGLARAEFEIGFRGSGGGYFDPDQLERCGHSNSSVGCVATPTIEAAGSGSISDPAERPMPAAPHFEPVLTE